MKPLIGLLLTLATISCGPKFGGDILAGNYVAVDAALDMDGMTDNVPALEIVLKGPAFIVGALQIQATHPGEYEIRIGLPDGSRIDCIMPFKIGMGTSSEFVFGCHAEPDLDGNTTLFVHYVGHGPIVSTVVFRKVAIIAYMENKPGE